LGRRRYRRRSAPVPGPTRRRRSARLASRPQDLDGAGEGHRATGASAGPAEYLVERRPAGLLDEPREEILLERLARRRRSLPKLGVNGIGHVLDLNGSHWGGAILAPQHPQWR